MWFFVVVMFAHMNCNGQHTCTLYCGVSYFFPSAQEVTSANEVLKTRLDGDRQSAAEKLARSLEQIQEMEQTVTQLRAMLAEREREVAELASSQQTLQHSLSEMNETLQHSESVSHSETEQLSSELEKLRQELAQARRQNEQQVASLEEKLQTSAAEREAVSEQAQLARGQVDALGSKLSAVTTERESMASQVQQLQSQLSKTLGALEFAQKELVNKDSTIQNLSQTLEEKKAALAESNTHLADVKGENAEKLTELLQKNEQVLVYKSSIEKELSEKTSLLKSHQEELERMRKAVEKLQVEHASMKEQLQVAETQAQVLEREKEASLMEKEMLRGQVGSLSMSQTELEEARRKQEEEVAQLRTAATESSSLVADLQQKLRNAKQQLGKALKSSKEHQAKQESLQADLERYEKENRQMKEQFDSAVKLMENKATEQALTLSQARQETAQKEAEISHLKQQVAADNRTVKELRERVTKVSADYKISTDRCRLIEQECQQLQGRVGELEVEVSQLQQTVADTTAERESLGLEHQALLSGMQEHEARMLQMTSQLAELARDKEGA